MEIPFIVAEDNDDLLEKQVKELIERAQRERTAVAIVARKGVFAAEEKSTAPVENGYPLFREEAIEAVLDAMPKDTIYVATTGKSHAGTILCVKSVMKGTPGLPECRFHGTCFIRCVGFGLGEQESQGGLLGWRFCSTDAYGSIIDGK